MTDPTLTDSEATITEQEVVDYLRKNPAFFVSQPGLLADINLPHDSGPAISLVERQVSVLRERNMDMRHRLSKLLDNARDNDRLFDKTKKLVLALLESKNLNNSLDTLLHSFKHDFDIHFTSILLFGDDALEAHKAKVVTINDARQHIGTLLKGNRAQCGTFTDTENGYLFDGHASAVGSVAMVPLIFGNTFGLLAIANRDANYYRSSMGTLFLSYIGEVLNRTLPKHLP